MKQSSNDYLVKRVHKKRTDPTFVLETTTLYYSGSLKMITTTVVLNTPSFPIQKQPSLNLIIIIDKYHADLIAFCKSVIFKICIN